MSVKYWPILTLLFFSFLAAAQPLTFESAVQEMLEKNFDIRIEANNTDIAATLNNAGNAGFLPSINADFGYDKSYTNTNQVFLDGREDNQTMAQRDALTASVILNWTLFDGFRMFAAKNILEANESLSQYFLRATAEEGMIMLATLYYGIIREMKMLSVLKQSLSISRERLALAEKRIEIGSGSKRERIQALLDVNADSALALNLEMNIANNKTELNLLLARNIMDGVAVPEEIPLDTSLVLNQMLQQSDNANIELLIARENVRIAQQEIRLAKSQYYPQAGVYGGYDYSRVNSEAGFQRSNQSYGPLVGVFVTFNLFNGLKNLKNVKAEKIAAENSYISGNKASASNEAFIVNSFRQYENAIRIFNLEQESVKQAEENLEIALKTFELGAISSVEFRDIQLQSLQAQSRLIQAQYDIRLNELELKRLAGLLALSF